MTQVVSYRLLIAGSVRKLLPLECKLNRDFNAALLFQKHSFEMATSLLRQKQEKGEWRSISGISFLWTARP